jgi:hypothetical protein
MKRRDFIESSLKVSAAVSTAGLLNQQAFSAVDAVAFQFSQTPLPYSNNVLEPYIDTLTMDIH